MIEVNRVSKVFGAGSAAVTALDDVSLHVPEGSFFTLLGPSGCGKTTLLRLIAGFELPTTGDIRLDGSAIGHLPPHERPVNTVFQSYALFPHMTVAENIGFGLRMLNRRRAEIEETVAEMLHLVQMTEFAKRRVDQLSGGQQQRVALARALAPRPKVLLLDEPLSALDLKLRKEMQVELKRLQAETGITFVFVTHDQGEALAMSDQIAVMSRGEVQQLGTPQDIYTRPASCFVADFIGDTNVVAAELRGYEDGRAVVRLGRGDDLRAPAARDDLAPGRVHVALQPEAISLVAADSPEARLRGKILSSTYFGAGSQVQLGLDDGTTLRANINGPLPQADQVGLRFTPTALHVLGD